MEYNRIESKRMQTRALGGGANEAARFNGAAGAQLFSAQAALCARRNKGRQAAGGRLQAGGSTQRFSSPHKARHDYAFRLETFRETRRDATLRMRPLRARPVHCTALHCTPSGDASCGAAWHGMQMSRPHLTSLVHLSSE